MNLVKQFAIGDDADIKEMEESFKKQFEAKKDSVQQESVLTDADKAIIDKEFADYVGRTIAPDSRGLLEIEEMGKFHGKLSKCGVLIRNLACN